MTPLRLELRGSRRLAAAILVAHAAAASALAVALPGTVGLATALGLALLGAKAARDRALLAGPGSVRALEIAPDGSSVVELAMGRRVPVRASARRHVGSWWVIVPLSVRPWALLIVRGMLAPAAHRRLRVWALWGRLPAPAFRGAPDQDSPLRRPNYFGPGVSLGLRRCTGQKGEYPRPARDSAGGRTDV
jgi:hypothetical protein